MSQVILIRPDGNSQAIYDETLDLRSLGAPSIQRASHVEPDKDGLWNADLSPIGGPMLGPFEKRSEAIQAEIEWLQHWLQSGLGAVGNTLPPHK